MIHKRTELTPGRDALCEILESNLRIQADTVLVYTNAPYLSDRRGNRVISSISLFPCFELVATLSRVTSHRHCGIGRDWMQGTFPGCLSFVRRDVAGRWGRAREHREVLRFR